MTYVTAVLKKMCITSKKLKFEALLMVMGLENVWFACVKKSYFVKKSRLQSSTNNYFMDFFVNN